MLYNSSRYACKKSARREDLEIIESQSLGNNDSATSSSAEDDADQQQQQDLGNTTEIDDLFEQLNVNSSESYTSSDRRKTK